MIRLIENLLRAEKSNQFRFDDQTTPRDVFETLLNIIPALLRGILIKPFEINLMALYSYINKKTC